MSPNPSLTCTHTLGARERPGINGLVAPSIDVYCTHGCGFSALGPNLPMAWLNAGAKIAGDRSAIELVQMRALLGQLVLVLRRNDLPEEDRLDEEATRIVVETAQVVAGMDAPPPKAPRADEDRFAQQYMADRERNECALCHEDKPDMHFMGGPVGQVILCNDCISQNGEVFRLHDQLSGAGCCLHVLTDDGNIRDSDVDFVADWARCKGHSFCGLVAAKIRGMSEEERFKWWGNGRDEGDRPPSTGPVH